MKKIVLVLPIIALFLHSCGRSEDALHQAEDLLAKAKDFYENESYESAETNIQQALPLLKHHHDQTKTAEAQAYLGKIKLAFGEFGAAIENVKGAIEISRSASDFRGEAKYLMLLGDIYASMGEDEKAIQQYRSSMSFSSAFDDRKSVADLRLKLANVLERLEQYEEASENCVQAMSYFKSTGDKRNAGAASMRLGKMSYLQQRYDEAHNYLNQAQSLIDPSDTPLLEAQVRLHLGLLYRMQGDWNNALRHFRDGTNRLRANRSGKEYETVLLFYLGKIYQDSGKWEEAKKFYGDALTIARKTGDRLAETYIGLFLLEIEEQSLGRNIRTPDLARLASSFKQIADRFTALEHKTGATLAQFEAAHLYRRLGKLDETLNKLDQGIETLESSYGEYVDFDLHQPYAIEWNIQRRIEDGYQLAAKTSLELNRVVQAFQYLERYRSNNFFKILKNAGIEIRYQPLRQNVYNAWEKIDIIRHLQLELSGMLNNRNGIRRQSHVDSLNSRIEEEKQHLSLQAVKIVEGYPNYQYFVRTKGVGLSEAQALIPRGTVVLQFLPLENELTILAVSKTNHTVRSVAINRDQLQSMVREYLSLLRDPNVYAGAAGEASLRPMTRFALLSTQLYDTFLRPVEAIFEKNLIIIPPSQLENFPFHVLEKQEANGTVRYLIELAGVDYLPGISLLKFRTSTAAKIHNVVGLGNPTGKNWSIDYELRDIRSFIKDTRILIGIEATWNNLINSKGDVLQLSTDFMNMNRVSPLGTVSFVNPDNSEDVVEIPFASLTTFPPFSVTVLSNQFGSGFGLYPVHGLVLRLNGTSDIFYNGWYSDRKTAKFFSEFFYTHLANGLAPGDAYRQALLNLIRTRDVNHPYQWGQFFHVGVG